MRRKVLIAGAGLLAAITGLLWAGPRLLRDPEISNPADVDDPSTEPPLPPEFFASDPGLLSGTGPVVQERVVVEGTSVGLEGAPYLIEFADRGYAFGHTDGSGYTKAFRPTKPVSHTILWYEDAVARWASLHGWSPESASEDGGLRQQRVIPSADAVDADPRSDATSKRR